MTKLVKWTKPIVEEFLSVSGLQDRADHGDSKAQIMCNMMWDRFYNVLIVKSAMENNVSVDTIKKYIRELKDIYYDCEKVSPMLKEAHYRDEEDLTKEINCAE